MMPFSDWRKIDLHIHTDLSKSTKNDDYKGLFDVSTLKQKITENNVGIFSLTDHNIINVPAYEEYYKNCKETDALLLLGVELDIGVESDTDGTIRGYHSLLIFNISEIGGVKRINKILEDAYVKKGITDSKQRSLTIGEIVDLLPEEDFFFIPHAGNTKSIVDAHKYDVEQAQKMVLLMQSAFEKVPEKARQKYNEGFNKVLDSAFQDRKDLAYIDFSDNHNISKYPCVHKGEDSKMHDFCYIKGKKNFETLRLAFIDPESRIKTAAQYADISCNPINHIESLEIQQERRMIASEIHFSPHLNVIIGGRSSGKSLLMNILGRKIGAIDDSNDAKYAEIIDPNGVKIKTKLDSEYKASSATNPNYVYINQGDIVNYFEGKNLGQLAKKAEKSQEYQAAIQNIKGKKADLSSLMEGLFIAYDKIHSAQKYEYVIYSKTLSQATSEFQLFEFDFAGLNEKYCSEDALIATENLIGRIQADINSLLVDTNLSFAPQEQIVAEQFQNLLTTKNDQIKSKRALSNKRRLYLDEVNKLITEINLEQSVGAQQKRTARKSIADVLGIAADRFNSYKNLKVAADLVQQFNASKMEKLKLNEDIDLVVEANITSSISETLLEGISGSNQSASLYINLNNLLRGQSLKIKNLKTNAVVDLKKKFNVSIQAIYDAIEKPIDYLDYKNGDTSNNKSPGFNSEKYLEVILTHSNSEIIFIDQPEDNLGNRFIADGLVNIVRAIKFKKQIFLVTHNPSIVVYGDAECVVFAENNENNISYSQSVLEDKRSQRDICSILDGGEYVFDKRSRKYNIKRILKGEAK